MNGKGKILCVVGLAAASMGLGACQRVSRAEYDAVMKENSALRESKSAEQAARQEAETRNASLEQENRDLAARLDKTGTGRTGGGGDTGFEGISGTNTYRSGSEVVVDIAGDVLFDSGSANLKATAKKSLDRVAEVIRSRYAGNEVRVEGYTDSDPIKKSGWKTNERLSGERAMAVEQYLVSKGLGKDKVYYAGFGSSRPKNSKKDSRRVEIVILGAKN
ncbi:MAG: OmpA family protein [Phycisphaerae bacterium]|nr:OmpA family protein [Phycisphaerae bacterium]